MKTRSLFRYCLFLSVLPSLSCSNSKQEDATPKTSHEVTVHVAGQNLFPSLQAGLTIRTSQRRAGALTTKEFASKRLIIGNIDTTYTVGTMEGIDAQNTDAITVRAGLHGCGGLGGYPPPVGSVLTATILVDGKKTMTVTLDRAMTGPNVNNDYWLDGHLFQEMIAL